MDGWAGALAHPALPCSERACPPPLAVFFRAQEHQRVLAELKEAQEKQRAAEAAAAAAAGEVASLQVGGGAVEACKAALAACCMHSSQL